MNTHIYERTTAHTLPIRHKDKVKHISLHEGRQRHLLLSTGMIRQPTVGTKTMTAALRNYLEHQQEPIYQDIPLGLPIIPPVKKHATGTPYYSLSCQGKPHTLLSKTKTVDYTHTLSPEYSYAIPSETLMHQQSGVTGEMTPKLSQKHDFTHTLFPHR